MAIRHTGHLGRAADAVAISQSAASHRLRDAERRLGVALTEAHGRSLRLTSAAQHLAEVAEVAQANLRSAEETARWMASAARATVRVALDFYDTAPWFAELIGPEAESSDIDIVRVPYDGVSDAVLRRRADVGVVVHPEHATVPADRWLASDELVGVVRSDHAAARRGCLQPTDVGRAVYLTAGERPQHGFEHFRFFEPAGVRPHRLRKVESLALIVRLIRDFGSVSVQPRLSLRDADLSGLVTVPLDATRIEVHWALALRPNASEAEEEVADVIRGVVAEP